MTIFIFLLVLLSACSVDTGSKFIVKNKVRIVNISPVDEESTIEYRDEHIISRGTRDNICETKESVTLLLSDMRFDSKISGETDIGLHSRTKDWRKVIPILSLLSLLSFYAVHKIISWDSGPEEYSFDYSSDPIDSHVDKDITAYTSPEIRSMLDQSFDSTYVFPESDEEWSTFLIVFLAISCLCLFILFLMMILGCYTTFSASKRVLKRRNSVVMVDYQE